MNRIFLILVVAFIWIENIRSELVINELMQSNIDCIMDDLNEFPDSWVELYNAGNQTIKLSDYSIGATSVSSWSLPSMNVLPQSFVIVYCDKAAMGMHTDFRLESGKGGSIFLLKNNVVVDSLINYPKQVAPNVSYGRQKEGSTTWGWQTMPTPGSVNCGALLNKVLGNPMFSIPGQVFTHSGKTALTLSLPVDAPEGTIIRYTTDGSEPIEESPLYTDTIFFPVSTIVRAKLFCEGWLSPRSTTQSYIYLKRDMTLPVISIASNPDFFFDPKIGIYTDGTYSSDHKNYEYDWRRPVNIEFFFIPDSSSLNQLCETRVHGGAQRGHVIHSLAIYANKRFGTKRFDYEFFPDQRPGITDYKSLILRNAGNDFHGLYMRDAICQRMASTYCDLDWQAWRPAILYLNGQYRGIVNIRERSNEDNIYTNYDGLEDIVMVENNEEIKSGNKQSWDEFVNFYSQRGHSLAEYQKILDVDEYLNTMVLNLFINNQDFPGNNLVFWRPSKEGGRWRILNKDLDFGLGLYNYPASTNTIEWFYTPGYDSNRNWANYSSATRLFRYAMENADFRNLFVDRAVVYMGDFLNHGRAWEIWKPMYEMIKTEYYFHKTRCNISTDYNSELEFSRTWLQRRPLYFIQQLGSKYNLGDYITMSVNMSIDEDVSKSMNITLNNIPLTRGIWQGRWFLSRPVSLWCEQARGWKIMYKEDNVQKEIGVNGSSCELTFPTSWSNVSINVVLEYTDFDNILPMPETKKILHDCQLFIIRDGKIYNLMGIETSL